MTNNETSLPERIARILDRHNSSFRSDSLVGSAVRNVETTKQINLLLAEVIDEANIELIERIRRAKPSKIASDRSSKWDNNRIAYTGGWNAYYEEMQKAIKVAQAEIKRKAKDMLGEK
jgi:hypothetical protein